MTSLYISPYHLKILTLRSLNSFDAIWDVKVDWFEDPNERRGGWSGVGKLKLYDVENSSFSYFLKRQQSHERLTFRHPFKGEPTFACEFQMMQHLAKHQVASLNPVAFGQREVNGQLQAFLMTEELIGFSSLDQVTVKLFTEKTLPLDMQRVLIKQVAMTVRNMHQSGVQHRSLYPKHLFVDSSGIKDAVVIDLEKSRIKVLPFMRTLYDLSTLNRHTEFWNKPARLFFYKQYCGVDRLNIWQKFLLKMIVIRSTRKKIHKTAKKSYQGTK